MATSVVFPRVQFFADNGRLLIGGRIHTYIAGTSSRAPTYKDAARAQPNTNPIILDGRAEASIYLAEGVEYKFVVEDSNGALIMTQEPVYGAIWPNAEDWPSDATLAYQYMLEAKAAASAIGPIKFYDTYAQADGDLPNLSEDDLVEIAQDETRASSPRARYRVVSSALVFVIEFDIFYPGMTGSMPRPIQSKLREIELSVTDFGAIGNWDGTTGTDNLAAFDACFAQAMVFAASGSGVKITIPRGRYRLTDTWDIYRPASPRRDIIIAGEDQLSSILVADFAGTDKALIRAVDPTGSTRVSPTSIRDLGFSASAAATPCPVYVDILGLGESRIERTRFSACNNTAMRIGSAQNVRMDDIVSFYGGHHFNYKATEGIRFTTTGGGTNIIADANIFSAGDVGKFISLYPSATENYIKYEIASYVSPTEVTVVGTTITATSVIGRFQPAQCSISNGSNLLTANSSCFVPSDVGRVIYIRRARTGAWGDALLRATITGFISGSQVTLDKQATNTVVDEFFAVPVIDLYRPSGVGVVAAPPNDVKINKLHIENFSGVGLIAQDVLFHHITEFKIHGEATPLDTFASASHMWLDDFGGELSGEFDGVCPGDTRFYACNFNDLGTFTWLATRRIRQETIFKIELFADQGGYVNVSNLNTYTASATGTQGLGIDANYNANNNDPRLVFSGFINMLGDAQRARIHTGRNSWFSPRGQLTPFRSGVDAVLNPSHITWNGTPPSSGTNLRYRWEQIAGLVSFSFRVEYATPGTGNSGVAITFPADMPLPVDLFGGGGTELAAAVVAAAMATATSGVAPSLAKSWMEADGSGGFKLMCALNSGSIAAAFATISGFYWTAQ